MNSMTGVRIDEVRNNKLWQALHQIPDEVLTEYLADNVIDEDEIEDITNRLEHHCRQQQLGLEISEQDHALIRHLVRHAVGYIRHEQTKGVELEQQMCQTSLKEVRSVMGHLLESGQIRIGSHEYDVTQEPTTGNAIPDERPEDYDREEPNEL